MPDAKVAPELSIARDELIASLRPLARLIKPTSKAQAVLSYADGLLSVELPGLATSVPAMGAWNGTARCAAGFILSLTRIAADVSIVTIRVANGRLDAGSVSIACEWEEGPAIHISLPLNADFKRVLSVAYHYSTDEIASAGLTNLVADAIQKRDHAIDRAHGELRSLGVTARDLLLLVDQRMRLTDKP